MSAFVLEIRSTADWKDCRYRAYTTSQKRRDEFMARVKKVQFTDSGHGLVPHARELQKGARREPTNNVLREHVADCLRASEGGK